MRLLRFFGMVNLIQNVLERVAIETAARMHGERRGFVEDDDPFVFVEDFDPGVDVRFDGRGKFLEVPFARMDDVGGRDGAT